MNISPRKATKLNVKQGGNKNNLDDLNFSIAYERQQRERLLSPVGAPSGDASFNGVTEVEGALTALKAAEIEGRLLSQISQDNDNKALNFMIQTLKSPLAKPTDTSQSQSLLNSLPHPSDPNSPLNQARRQRENSQMNITPSGQSTNAVHSDAVADVSQRSDTEQAQNDSGLSEAYSQLGAGTPDTDDVKKVIPIEEEPDPLRGFDMDLDPVLVTSFLQSHTVTFTHYNPHLCLRNIISHTQPGHLTSS